MNDGQLLSDDLLPSNASASSGSNHPTDSSRVLLGLMTLSRQAEVSDPESLYADALEGVISPNVLRSLLSALQFRNVTTVKHSRRVAMLSVGMGRYLGWEGRELKVLEIAALLHDIGKIGVPDSILFKPGKLSPDEAELMALHRHIGVDVLQACRADKEVIEIISQSLTHYNGADTVCRRRVGSDVHQGARILSVADAYDSLSHEQAYREAKPHEEVMKILMEAAGTQFDGNILCALSRWVESEGLPFSNHSDEQQEAAGQPHAGNPENALEASTLCHIFSYLYLLESLYDGFYLVDSDLRFVVWNHGVEELTGHAAPQLLDQTWTSELLSYTDESDELLSDQDCPLHRVMATGKPATSQVSLQRSDGEWIEVELQSVPLLDEYGRLQGVAEIFHDMSRSAQSHERELKLAATRDGLTSTANRRELERELSQLVSDFSQSPDTENFSVIFLDVDHFKTINDTFGHTVGDQVLVDVARLLQHETYSGELVGRYGGEEFLILCPDTELKQAVKRAERLRIAINRAEIADLTDFEISASFGVTEVERGDTVETLVRRVDRALYLAKQGGRNKTCSLTNEEIERNRGKFETITDSAGLLYKGTFSALVAADIVIYKLGGFLTDTGAKLLQVSPNRALIRLGTRGLIPFWGASDERRPVTIEVKFGEQPAPELKRRNLPTQRVDVEVHIRPVGWVRNPEAFQQRAKEVIKTLRSYFVA